MNDPEILLEIDGNLSVGADTESLLRRVCFACLKTEGASGKVSIHLSLTDDHTIADVNARFRNNPNATDVLSFPSCPFTPEAPLHLARQLLRQEYDPDTGACFLGDVVISVPHARKQAKEYGHSFQREIAYLMAHAVFHLMGYDHIKEEDKTIMREQEEKSLVSAGLITDEMLLEKARQAMEFSYSPYSHFRVGACLRCTDGSVYTGCNIENASFGATNCAERTAVFKAVSEGHRSFDAIAIASDHQAPWPCGICRQVLNEFSPDMRVIVTWEGHVEEAGLKDLLPHGFGSAGSAKDFIGQ